MTIRTRVIFVFVFCLLLGGEALALNLRDNVAPFNYTRRVWQVQDGLPEDVVQAFAQTHDKYLWIGTTAGLIRFDGAEFLVYDHRNTPGLVEKSIFCLMVARDGGLWIGTEGGGLLLYQNGVFHSFSSSEGLTNGFVRVIFQDRRDRIWIGTDCGLFRISGSRVDRLDDTENVPALAVHTIREDAREGLWVGGSRLLRIEHETATEYRLRGELSQYRVKSSLVAADGTVWVGTVSGLYKKSPGRASSHMFDRVKGISGTVRALWQSSEGTLWVATIGKGVFVLDDNNLISLRSPGRLPSNTVLNFFQDAEENIWIGTQHGMVRLSKTSVTTIPLPDAADSDFGTVYLDQNGDLWMASSSLFRARGGVAKPYHVLGLSGVRVRNVFRDNSGALWLGTDGVGAFRVRGAEINHFTTKDGLANNYIRAFMQSRDGSIWMATDFGVSRWFAGHFISYQIADGLCYFNTRALLEDRHGDIWIGTERGLSHLHGGVFEHDAVTEKLREEKIWSMHLDSDGALWFATRTNGLYRWKAGRMSHLTMAQGLVSDSIYQIIEDPYYNFWMSGPEGVSRIRRSELDRAAEDPLYRLPVTVFGISQGQEMTEIYGGTQPAGVLASDGVWFPSSKGPVHISLEGENKKERPPVVIDKVLVDGQERAFASGVVLKPDSRKIQFGFTAVSLRSPEAIRFLYKLEGFDPHWTDAGAERQIYYTNLPPGTYRFRVLAFNMANPGATSETSLQVRQKPYLYRTVWFLLGCLGLIAALIWISHLKHLREVRLRFDAVLEERSRVAREMHDTLIQGCVGVSTLLEGASSLAEEASIERSGILDYARAQLRLTLDEARRALWNLRHDTALTVEIGPLLFSLADEIAKGAKARISCQTRGKPFAIQTSQARELLMVTREALYNAAHHSGPSMITLRIAFRPDRLNIQVSDDGRGFDPVEVETNNGHYGLVGMRERVERMNGEFVLKSTRGSGTHLNFNVPCKPAFGTKTGMQARN